MRLLFLAICILSFGCKKDTENTTIPSPLPNGGGYGQYALIGYDLYNGHAGPFINDFHVYPMMIFHDTSSIYVNIDSLIVKQGQASNVLNMSPNVIYGSDTGGVFHCFRTDSLKPLWSKILNKPSIVLETGSYSNPTWLTSLAQSKITYTGSNTQYIKGDGTFGRAPVPYTGTTNGSGEYTITFSSSYSVAPNIQVTIQGDHPAYTPVVSSKSTMGCTIKVYTLSSILALGLVPQYSAVSGVVVDVIVTEK